MARIYWLLGSATDREAETAIALSHALPESWSVICNKMLWTPYARRFELDMVIVGEHGVYVVDEKSWRSPVKCGTEWWTIANGKSVKSPLNKVENAAAVLGTGLRDEVAGLRSVVLDGMLVHAFVLFSRPGIELDLDQCPTPDRILRMEQAAALLKSFDAYRGVKGRDMTPFSDGIVRWILGTEEPVPPPAGLDERDESPGPREADTEKDQAETEEHPSVASAQVAGTSGMDRPSETRRRWWWLAAIAVLVIIAVVGVVVPSSRHKEKAGGAVGATSTVPVEIGWQDAHAHVGEYAAVEGVVIDVERSPMGAKAASTFINIGKEFHPGMPADPSRFYAVVPKVYDARFRSEVAGLPGGPSSPAEAYAGRDVRVTGRIDENSRGEPFIEVHSTDSVAVID